MGASRLRRIATDPSLFGFIAAALVALALALTTQWLAVQQRRAASFALQSQEVLGLIARTRAALVDIQNGHRGYTLEGTPEALEPYMRGVEAMEESSARLRVLLRDAPGQQTHLAEFERWLPQRLATAAEIVEARRSGGVDAAHRIIRTGAAAREMAELRRVLDAMEKQQELVFQRRSGELQATLLRLSIATGVVTLLLLPALAVLYAQNRRRQAAQQQLLVSEGEKARVEQAQLRLQQLSARMVDHQEEERRRLAYELHEDMAQSMSALRIDLERARGANGSSAALEEAIRLLGALIAQTRDMVQRLRPTMLDDLGLAEAIEGELAMQARRHGWTVRLEVEPKAFPDLPPQLATACFRVAQEALANAAWHAQAKEVEVALRLRGRDLELLVQDDGVGFDVERHLAAGHEEESFGLIFMRERARQVGGTVEVARGSGGRGVRVRLSVPDWQRA